MNLSIQPKFTQSVSFNAKMDEDAYQKIIKSYPQFKLPKDVQVVSNDVFEKSTSASQPAKNDNKNISKDAIKEYQDSLTDPDHPEYDDPNWHGYTEYGTFPTGNMNTY